MQPSDYVDRRGIFSIGSMAVRFCYSTETGGNEKPGKSWKEKWSLTEKSQKKRSIGKTRQNPIVQTKSEFFKNSS